MSRSPLVAVASGALLLSACAVSPAEELPVLTQSEPLTRQSPIATGDATCARGGQRIEGGTDLDGDRLLDPDEVTSSRVVCAREPGAPRVVFVSSIAYTATELLEADAKCQGLADRISALQGKRFRAFIARGASAPEGFTTDGSFIRVDGTVVARDLASMLRDGTHWFKRNEDVLLAPISLTEGGDAVNDLVLTGADHDASIASPCGEEPINAQLTDGVTERDGWRAGRSKRVDNAWLDATSITCAMPARIYCFEQ